MARYIDAEELELEYYGLSIHGTMAVKSVLPIFTDLLEKQPTADVEEVKHGEWIHSSRGFDVGAAYECSICHSPSGNKHFYRRSYAFCPDCGARMDGGKEE